MTFGEGHVLTDMPFFALPPGGPYPPQVRERSPRKEKCKGKKMNKTNHL